MKLLLATAMCFVLSGCWFDSFIVRKADPFDAHCDPQCFAPCTEPRFPVTANPDSAITAEKVEHAYRGVCETRRNYCAQCIQRAKDFGAIK